MAKLEGKKWVAYVPIVQGERPTRIGRFPTEGQAISAEENWWGNPRNVPYTRWVQRLSRVKGTRRIPVPKYVICRDE